LKKVAVVILNWNGKKLLEHFLPSITEYSNQATVYVADNCSTDDSVAFVKTNFPTVKIIQNKENYGFAKGYNEALKSVEEDIFALVNSDIEVTKDWLQPIIDLYNSDSEIAIIQPKIKDFNDKSKFEYAGAAGGFIDKYGYPFCRGRIFDKIEEDTNQYNDVIDIFWASGACFFIKKEVFLKLNGFDSDFFAHQEEIDLCWRALNKGFLIKYCGYSTVYHIGGATLNASNPKKTYLNFRNSLLMLLKNIPKNRIFFIILTRLILDGIAGIKFLLEGKFKHFLAIINAHFSFYNMIFRTLKKRDKHQLNNYYYTKSILYINYFKSGMFVDINKN